MSKHDRAALVRLIALYEDTLRVIAHHPSESVAAHWIKGKAHEALIKKNAALSGEILGCVSESSYLKGGAK